MSVPVRGAARRNGRALGRGVGPSGEPLQQRISSGCFSIDSLKWDLIDSIRYLEKNASRFGFNFHVLLIVKLSLKQTSKKTEQDTLTTLCTSSRIINHTLTLAPLTLFSHTLSHAANKPTTLAIGPGRGRLSLCWFPFQATLTNPKEALACVGSPLTAKTLAQHRYLV